MILVTGAPRSGTTPLGHIFSKFLGYSVLHEPFNYHTGIDNVDYYFEGADGDRAELKKVRGSIIRIGNNDVIFKDGCFPGDSFLKRISKRYIGGRTKTSYRGFDSTKGVIKDPFLSLSMLDVSDLFESVVVAVRPPGGVCRSFSRYGWIFPELFPDDTKLNKLLHSSDVELSGLIQSPEFYALYIQYSIFSQLLNAQSNSRFFVVNMASLPSLSKEEVENLFSPFFTSDEIRGRFYEDLRGLYRPKRWSLSRLTIHNHGRGASAVTAANRQYQVEDSRLENFFNRVELMYLEVLSTYGCE